MPGVPRHTHPGQDAKVDGWLPTAWYPVYGRQGNVDPSASLPAVEPAPEDVEAEMGGRILCRGCLHPITDAAQRLAVAGSHHHTFFNPAGILFEIGCFRTAMGCRTVGESSDLFTWFAGWGWTIAVCGGCHGHLGWCYRNDQGASFYGLILNRLREEEQAGHA